MVSRTSLRQMIGAAVFDLPRFVWALRPADSANGGAPPWIFFCNRDEVLDRDAKDTGAWCRWQWTSDVHLARVFPGIGRYLMAMAFRDCPIRLREAPESTMEPAAVAFIIGHRGSSRLPHLLTTLKSIAGQRGVAFECIVVEQSETGEAGAHLPPWVRYVHTPCKAGDPYSRARAFNAGARMARAPVLILHDNDMILPQDYAAEILRHCKSGFEVVNIKRFIFYLQMQHSQRIMQSGTIDMEQAPESVVQNLEAGGSLAISKDAYLSIGGFDEAFVGWGGEDNEFWERAQSKRVWPYGYQPILHLWHAPQPEKTVQNRGTGELYRTRSAIPVPQRIADLTARDFGNPECRIGRSPLPSCHGTTQ